MNRKSTSRFARPILMVVSALALTISLAAPASAEDYLDTRHAQIDYSDASSRAFVGSPSLVVLPNGDYLATHADFGGGTTGRTTQVFRSRNEGVAWEAVAGSPVQPMTWATIFEHDGDVYLMGVARDGYGDPVISRSQDEGENWSDPVALLRGSYHTGDTPVLVHNGRIYKTYEENLKPPGWSPNFRPMMISADVDADLTDPKSWTRTNNVDKGSVLEGNPIAGPDGKIWNLLRYNDARDKAWLTKLDPAKPDELVNVGPIAFPYGVAFSKFYIIWDKPSQRYLLVGNAETSSTGAITQRNHLDLYESKDLSTWKHVRTLVEDDSSANWAESVRLTSFSQPTAQIDGDDLLVVSRTAYDGAANYHDANRLSFHRYPDFRRYLDADDELAHYSFDDPKNRGADVSKASDTDADITAATKIVNGRVGQGIEISGQDSFVDLGNRIHPLLDGQREVTVSAWIKPNSFPDGEGASIFGSRVNGGGAGVDLLLNGSNVQLGGRSVGSDSYQSRSFPYPDSGEWHHLAAVWDFANDDLRLYIDGKLQSGEGTVAFASDTYEVGNPGQPDRIGVTPAGDKAFDGVIDEVRIFGAAIDGSGAERLAGKEDGPRLDGIKINGAEMPEFNPDVESYDVVLPEGKKAKVAADATRGSKVRKPRRSIVLSDVPSNPITFDVSDGDNSKSYSLTVRRASSNTALAGVRVATGDSRSFTPSENDYRVHVKEGVMPLDLDISSATPLKSWDGATAEVVRQPDPNDRNPIGAVRVVAEDGTTEMHDVTFDVERQLVSATVDTTDGDAPFNVVFTAVPTKWAVGDATYAWNFGDGSTGTGRETSHTYERVGTYDAKVTLTDKTGTTDEATVRVTVRAPGRLVGSWSFDDDIVGVAQDDSLYGNDATVTGGKIVPGHDETGKALHFDSSGGVTLDDTIGTDLNEAPAITISGWIRPDKTPASGKIGNWVFGTRISGGGAGAELYMLGDSLRVGGRSQIADPCVRSDYRFTADNDWHHVAAVLDYANNHIRLYLDGQEQTALSHAGSFGLNSYAYTGSSQPDSIGRSPDGVYRFGGDLDNIQIYGRVLTADEVKADASQYASGPQAVVKE